MSRPIVSRLHREVAKLPASLYRSDALVGGEWIQKKNTFDVAHPGYSVFKHSKITILI